MLTYVKKKTVKGINDNIVDFCLDFYLFNMGTIEIEKNDLLVNDIVVLEGMDNSVNLYDLYDCSFKMEEVKSKDVKREVLHSMVVN